MKNTQGAASQVSFAKAVHADIRSSTFLRPHSKRTTFSASQLIPVYVDEILPGDNIDMKLSGIVRMTTPLFPTMDDVEVKFYAFYAPNRILWSHWTDLMGENKGGAWVPLSNPAPVPTFRSGSTTPSILRVGSRTIGDYMDFPWEMDLKAFNPVSLDFRMNVLVYNEWWRNQNFQAPLPLNIDADVDYLDGANKFVCAPQDAPLYVNRPKDMFSSCLPSTQKGNSPLIPVELNAYIPVFTRNETSDASIGTSSANSLRWANAATGAPVNLAAGTIRTHAFENVDLNAGMSSSYSSSAFSGATSNTVKPRNLWAGGVDSGIQLTQSTIAQLRTAWQIQKLYEKDSVGGTRYVESLKMHFGIDAQDYRLQRPEFLGVITSRMGIYQVPQTSQSTSASPLGNLAAFGYAQVGGRLFNKSFVEHGRLIVYAVARQFKTYQNGLPRMYSRTERLDFYFPVLANITEQPIYNREIFAQSNAALGAEVFGYNEAWAQYRYKPNLVSGQFRSGVAGSLFEWLYADVMSVTPTLNSAFITDNSRVNIDRTITLPSAQQDQFIADLKFDCKYTRSMPLNSVPGFVDHF